MNFFIASAHAQAGAETQGGWISLLFPLALFAVFYFIAIRPQRKRQKEHQNMLGELAKGDEVVTSAGLLGRVSRIEEEYVVLKVADNTELKFQKHSVSGILPKGTIKSIE